MRNIALAMGLFVCGLIMLSTTSAKALTPVELLASTTVTGQQTSQSPSDRAGSIDADTIIFQALSEIAKPIKKAAQNNAVKTHVVVEGDTLSSIAKAHDTTWQRIYDKNTNIAAPDTITVGAKIVVPEPSEKLKKRPLQVAPPISVSSTAMSSAQYNAAPVSSARGSSAGNSYYAGYCTWYAKSRRPDMPNNLGNAITWVSQAAAQGFATGSTPRAGAIGQQGNHVVYVERVNKNGSVTISEMNYEGYGVVSSRTVPAGTFLYIY